MSIFAVISDCHLHQWSAFAGIEKGMNDRLYATLKQIDKAACKLVDEGGDTLYITGDLFHVRGSISPTVLNPAIDLFKRLHSDYGVKTRILTGNHDLESRDSDAISSACESLRTVPGVEVISKPMVFPDDKVVMIPWFESMDKVREEIQWAIDCFGPDMSQHTLMIHAPLNGVIIGIPDHGFYAAELAKHGFKNVFCGHYHNFKAFEGCVYSVGATTHQTWNDVGTKAGYLIVQDGIVTHHDSSAPKFIDFDSDWDMDKAIDNCGGNYVRIRLGSATDEEVSLMRDHVIGLGAKGCVVQAIPVPKTTATARTGSVSSAPTVRESIEQWVDSNIAANKKAVSKLCQEIIDQVEAVEV